MSNKSPRVHPDNDSEDIKIDEEKFLCHPLSPRDPSAGLIRAQGHPIFHFAFMIALGFFVTYDEGPFYCFTQDVDDDGVPSGKFVRENIEDS